MTILRVWIITICVYLNTISIFANQQMMQQATQAFAGSLNSMNAQQAMMHQSPAMAQAQMMDQMLFAGCSLPQPLQSVPQCMPQQAIAQQQMQMQSMGMQEMGMHQQGMPPNNNFAIMQQISQIRVQNQNQMQAAKQCMERVSKQTGDNLNKRINSFQQMLDQMKASKDTFKKTTEALRKSILESQGILYGELTPNANNPTLADRLKGTSCQNVMGSSQINRNKRGLNELRNNYQVSKEDIADGLNNISSSINQNSTPSEILQKLGSVGDVDKNFKRQVQNTLSRVQNEYKKKRSDVLTHLGQKGLHVDERSLNQLINSATQGESSFAEEIAGTCYRNSSSHGFSQAVSEIQSRSRDANLSQTERSFYLQLQDYYNRFGSGQITMSQLKAGVSKVVSSFPHQSYKVNVSVGGVNTLKNYNTYLNQVSQSCKAMTGFDNGSAANSNGHQVFQTLSSITPKNLFKNFAEEVHNNIKTCGEQIDQVFTQEKSRLTQNVANYNTAYLNLHQQNLLLMNRAKQLFDQESLKIENMLPGTSIVKPEGLTISQVPPSFIPDELGGDLSIMGARGTRGEDILFGMGDMDKAIDHLSKLKNSMADQRQLVLGEMEQKIASQREVTDRNEQMLQQAEQSCQMMAQQGSGSKSANPQIFCAKFDRLAQNPAAGCKTADQLYEDALELTGYISMNTVQATDEFRDYCNSYANEGESEDDTANSTSPLSLDNLCSAGNSWNTAKNQVASKTIPQGFLGLSYEEVMNVRQYIIGDKTIDRDLKKFLNESSALEQINEIKTQLKNAESANIRTTITDPALISECNSNDGTFCREVKSFLDKPSSEDTCKKLNIARKVMALRDSRETETITTGDSNEATIVINDDKSFDEYEEKRDEMSLDEVSSDVTEPIRGIASVQNQLKGLQGRSFGERMRGASCDSIYNNRGIGQHEEEHRNSFSLEDIQSL